MSKPFQRSELTSNLIRYLGGFEKGQSISYEDISEAVRTPIDAQSHHLRSARFILERDQNAIWLTVPPGLGVYRLKDPEIAARLRGWWLRGARRKLARGGDQASVVDQKQLDIDEQARFGVDSLQRELAFQTLQKSTQRQLEKVARGTSNDLPSYNILEWAISLMPKRDRPSS